MSSLPHKHTDPKLLARLIHAPGESERWTAADLAAMLKHQLAADLQDDLQRMLPGGGPGIAALCRAAVPAIATFRELLFHPSPPLDLLVFLKEFAKAAPLDRDAPLPVELVAVLYVAAMGLALAHHRQAISSLGDVELTRRLQWAIGQPWVDDAMRALLISVIPASSAKSPP